MALRLEWSPEALEDVEAIAGYIERDSPWYATAIASRIVNAAESVPEQPGLGRVVPELGQGSIRERFVYSYRVIFIVSRTIAFSLLRSFTAVGCCSSSPIECRMSLKSNHRLTRVRTDGPD